MTQLLLDQKKVYDPVLRGIHAWNALLVVLLLLLGRVAEWLGYTPDAASLRHFHLLAGYGLVLGLVARITWGVVGPEHARLSALWRPRAWWRMSRTRELFPAPAGWGHQAPAAALYLLFYLLLLGMAVTGLALAAIDQGSGPLYLWLGHDVTLKHLFRGPHTWLSHAVLLFALVHLALLIWHEVRHGVPLAQAMLSGFQYRKADREAE